MRIEQEEIRYAGVSVNNPSIVSGIQALYKQGHSVGHIMKVIGMPSEVVERHIRDYKNRPAKESA
jgi:hypothetical protein